MSLGINHWHHLQNQLKNKDRIYHYFPPDHCFHTGALSLPSGVEEAIQTNIANNTMLQTLKHTLLCVCLCVSVCETHPSSLTLDPGLNVVVQVNCHPLHDPAHQWTHLLLHTLDTQRPAERKKPYDAAPVDAVPEHFIHHVLEALVSCGRRDVQLVVQIAEGAGISQLKLVGRVPEGLFHRIQARR